MNMLCALYELFSLSTRVEINEKVIFIAWTVPISHVRREKPAIVQKKKVVCIEESMVFVAMIHFVVSKENSIN